MQLIPLGYVGTVYASGQGRIQVFLGGRGHFFKTHQKNFIFVFVKFFRVG